MATQATARVAWAAGSNSTARAWAGVRWLRAAWVAVAFLFPLAVVPGLERPFSTPKFFLLGIVVALGGGLVGHYRVLVWPALPQGFQAALVAWLAALGASAAFGNFTSLTALLLPLFAGGWFLLALGVRPRAERLALAIALSGGVVGLISLMQFFGFDFFALLGWASIGGSNPRMRVFATLGNPNFVAAFLVGLLPLSLALRSNSAGWRALLRMALAFETGGIFATGSRATILGLGAALLWLVVLRRWVKWRTLGVAAGLVAASVVALAPVRPLSTTLQGRAYVWKVAAPHLGQRPLAGFGPGAFEPQYAQWQSERWQRGAGSEAEREFVGVLDHAHNDFLEIAVDHGLAGLIGWLGLLVMFLAFAWRNRQAGCGELVAGASAGVVALAAVALVDFPLHRPTELFLFWTLMSVGCLAAREERP